MPGRRRRHHRPTSGVRPSLEERLDGGADRVLLAVADHQHHAAYVGDAAPSAPTGPAPGRRQREQHLVDPGADARAGPGGEDHDGRAHQCTRAGRDRGDPLAAAGEAEPVGGRRGERDRCADRRREHRVASSRRGPSRGRLPITWTATLPISWPAPATRAAVSVSSATPEAPAHAGSAVPKFEPEVAEAGRREQRVAHRVGGDVGVGVPLEALRLVGPGEAGEVQRDAVGETVHVDADAVRDSVRTCGHGMIMPEKQSAACGSAGVWALAGLLAGCGGLATSLLPSRCWACAATPVTDVAELVIRLTPGPVAEHAIQIVGHQRQAAAGHRRAGDPGAALRGVRGAGRRSPGGARRRLRRPRGGRAGRRPVAVRRAGRAGSCRSWSASHLAAAACPLLTEPLRPQPLRGTSTPQRRFLRDGGRGRPCGSLAVPALSGWKAGGPAAAPSRPRAPLLRLTGRHRRRRSRGASEVGLDGVEPWQTPATASTGSTRRSSPPADRAAGLDAPDPRHGRPRDHADLRTTCSTRQRTELWVTLNCVSNPVGGDLISNAWWSGVRLDDLLAEAGRAAGRRRREADVGRRVDLRYAARRRSPTTATRCSRSR